MTKPGRASAGGGAAETRINKPGPVVAPPGATLKLTASGLRDAYEEVGRRTWLNSDFIESNLELSRALFTPESLAARSPRPKKLEVFALLSGLSFDRGFTHPLAEVQQRISSLIGERLHYWVASTNLGVEYCVFKWPNDIWEPQRLDTIGNVLASIHRPAFRFTIGGVQINPDGCVVAKGFDENGIVFRIREQLKREIPFLPTKQSEWTHVPLGRILEPLGTERFTKLAGLMASLKETTIAATEIRTMKLIHETRWYMEERTLLAEYPLDGAAQGRES